MRFRESIEYNQAFFLYTAALKITDALTVLGLWYATWYLRFESVIAAPKGIPERDVYSRVALPLVLVYSAVFHVVGAYKSDRIHFGFRAGKKIAQGAVLGTLVFISILYFLDQMRFSRVFLVLFAGVLAVGLPIERAILQGIWKWLERTLVRKSRVLLIGEGQLLEMYLAKIDARKPYPVEWIGRLGSRAAAGGRLAAIPYLGEDADLERVLRNRGVDQVVVAYPTERAARYADILGLLANELVGVKVLPDFGKYSTFTYSAEDECGIPLLAFNKPPTGNTDRALKRLFDIAGSLAFLALFSPLYLALALLVRLTSRGPIFYSQVRVGADGKVFTLYKFRSMRVDAEARTGAVWAVAGDPRTTAVGRWMRRTNLDELPQFWNVLKGDMSLVGPRPERPVFVDQFRKDVPKYMLRHKMKSGLTGWAQVNGWRGNTSIEERIKHDLYYIGHWSHLFDFKILVLTLLRGFTDRNAY